MILRGGGGGSRELPLDVKENHSRTVVFYFAKSFTRLDTSEFHDNMIFFTFNNKFCWCSYSGDDWTALKSAGQVL